MLDQNEHILRRLNDTDLTYNGCLNMTYWSEHINKLINSFKTVVEPLIKVKQIITAKIPVKESSIRVSEPSTDTPYNRRHVRSSNTWLKKLARKSVLLSFDSLSNSAKGSICIPLAERFELTGEEVSDTILMEIAKIVNSGLYILQDSTNRYNTIIEKMCIELNKNEYISI